MVDEYMRDYIGGLEERMRQLTPGNETPNEAVLREAYDFAGDIAGTLWQTAGSDELKEILVLFTDLQERVNAATCTAEESWSAPRRNLERWITETIPDAIDRDRDADQFTHEAVTAGFGQLSIFHLW